MPLKWNQIKPYLIILIGLAINSLGWTGFLIPGKIVGGGVSGIGTLIYYMTGFPVGVSFFLANAVLLLLAVRTLGAKFGGKTIFAIVVISVFLSLFQLMIKKSLVQDAFMATLIGGALTGIGIGITFSQGGSTGGTDIIAMMINKYRNISPGRIIFFIDVFIISSSYFIFHSIEKIIYGFVCMAVAAYAIDMVLSGSRETVQVMIISAKNTLIADRIGIEMNRGITLLDGKGWYSKEETQVVMTMIHKSQTHELMQIVNDIDNKAFVSIARIVGVYGKGFEQYRR